MEYSVIVHDHEKIINSIHVMGESEEVVHIAVDTVIKRPRCWESWHSDLGNVIEFFAERVTKLLARIEFPGNYDTIYMLPSRYGIQVFLVKYNEDKAKLLWERS